MAAFGTYGDVHAELHDGRQRALELLYTPPRR